VTPPARLWLQELDVRDFRNIARLELTLPAEGLAVIGDNGHGKTNLLESIYYLQLFRSMRGARDVDLVRFGTDGFHVNAHASGGPSETVAAGFDRTQKRKRVTVNGSVSDKLGDSLGSLPAVTLSPRDVQMVSGGPADRRRFLDVVLALTSRRYLNALQRYRSALRMRNAALREASRLGSGPRDMDRISVWEPPLAQEGAVLWRERAAWVESAAPRFGELCSAIGESGDARMRLAATIPEGDIAAGLLDALAANRRTELRRGITQVGPHRDDLALALGGRELRLFGSGGQQRTAAIALRMLEAATLRESTGIAPLLLLDDPFAELDARRSARILSLLDDAGMGQAILAVPRAADIPRELSRLGRLHVTSGTFSHAGET
jgi:DNA replication and repair protein RecF